MSNPIQFLHSNFTTLQTKHTKPTSNQAGFDCLSVANGKGRQCVLPRGSRTTHSERSANVTDGISRNRSDRLSASPRYFRHYYRGGPPIKHSAQCTPHYFEILDQETPSENAHPQRDFLPTAKGRASERPPSAAGVSYPSSFVLPSPPHPSARLRSRSAVQPLARPLAALLSPEADRRATERCRLQCRGGDRRDR